MRVCRRSAPARPLLASLLLILFTAAAPAAESPQPLTPKETAELRATMHEVFDALAQLLPASLDDARFASESQRPKIDGWLHTLEAASAQVEKHTGARDAGFGEISRSLARDVAETRRRFERGHYLEAQFYISELTSNCVACHSRLPKARDYPLAKNLTDRPEVQALEPAARGRLLVATRQFDAALGLYEKRFADPAARPTELDLDGELLSYLIVCVRVQRDFARPRAALAKLAARPDAPRYLALDLRAWQAQLDELAAAPKGAPTLTRAAELVARGAALSAFPADRVSLVYDLAASSELMRLVALRQAEREELAEAYFRLGAIAARVERGAWVSEIDQDLETSIRLAPGGPYAETAYATLEEYTVEAYGGTEGADVPNDVQARLNELRALLDGAHGAKPSGGKAHEGKAREGTAK
ncbi:MAG: hypothetical protein ACHQ6T_10015 [Myxococcota bacterium]